jgi:hypothetical protein
MDESVSLEALEAHLTSGTTPAPRPLTNAQVLQLLDELEDHVPVLPKSRLFAYISLFGVPHASSHRHCHETVHRLRARLRKLPEPTQKEMLLQPFQAPPQEVEGEAASNAEIVSLGLTTPNHRALGEKLHSLGFSGPPKALAVAALRIVDKWRALRKRPSMGEGEIASWEQQSSNIRRVASTEGKQRKKKS